MTQRGSFFHREKCAVTALFGGETVSQLQTQIRWAQRDGADAIAIELSLLPLQDRTVDQFRKLLSTAPELPFMFILYRNDAFLGKDDEARQEYLLRAVDAGAEVVDVMGDLFDPAPFELTMNPEAIAKQKKLIDEIHRRGGKVVMSSHMSQDVRTANQVLAHLKEEDSRGADLLKIVTGCPDGQAFLEVIRTTMLLHQELKKPFIHLCNGAYSRPHRYLGPKLGSAVAFAVLEERPDTQPSIAHLRNVFDTVRWDKGTAW